VQVSHGLLVDAPAQVDRMAFTLSGEVDEAGGGVADDDAEFLDVSDQPGQLVADLEHLPRRIPTAVAADDGAQVTAPLLVAGYPCRLAKLLK
jgi:hypothetical protein